MGRHRILDQHRERNADLRVWHLINYTVNGKISDENKRVKPGDVFPSLAFLGTSENTDYSESETTPDAVELREAFKVMTAGLARGSR